MRLVRTATALALTGSLFAVGASQAATAPVCKLMTDAEGDVTAVQSKNLDIVSGDIASDSKNLTGVIRVAGLSSSDSTAPSGFGHQVRFNVDGGAVPFYFLASNEPSPIGSLTFEYGTVDGNILTKVGDAVGVVDTKANEIRMSAPTSVFGVKAGSKITGMQAVTQRRFVVLLSGGDSSAIDDTKTYIAGTKSCVTPGK